MIATLAYFNASNDIFHLFSTNITETQLQVAFIYMQRVYRRVLVQTQRQSNVLNLGTLNFLNLKYIVDGNDLCHIFQNSHNQTRQV